MNLSNPLDIVIALLTAFDKKDWDAIVPYFDSANQRRFLPWSEEHKQKFVQYIEKKTSPIIPFNIKEIQDGGGFLFNILQRKPAKYSHIYGYMAM